LFVLFKLLVVTEAIGKLGQFTGQEGDPVWVL
jgi:hypothetical protein